MNTKNPCYQLIINPETSIRNSLVEILLANDYSDFIEGSVDFSLHPDGDLTFDPNVYFENNTDLGPIIFFNDDKDYLNGVMGLLEKSSLHATNKVSWTCEPLVDSNWQESWKESFRPLYFENELVVFPPWENKEGFKEPFKLEIDPGMAFGTGQHETTQLCLSLAIGLKILKPHISVLDVGTGSGILALAAALYGCCPILGIDVDPSSIHIAKSNALANQLQTKTTFSDIALEQLVSPQKDFPSPPYDLIFANIQLTPLLNLLPILSECLKTEGKIIFSGILSNEVDIFVNAFHKNGIRLIEKRTKNDWVGFLCAKM